MTVLLKLIASAVRSSPVAPASMARSIFSASRFNFWHVHINIAEFGECSANPIAS